MPPARKPVLAFQFSSETLAGLIYGIVTALAVIAVVANKYSSVWLIAGAAVGTSSALVLTFVYAHWLAGSYSPNTGHGGLRAAWRNESPTLVGPVLLAGLLLVLHFSGTSTASAALAAMWTGVVLLFFLGYRISLQAGRGFLAALAFGLIDASIGVVIVLVKALLH